jgi:hypothetical protein
MKYTINELANSKGVSQPVREALLHMADYKQLYEQVCEQYDVLAKELEVTNKQVEILSDALAESRREVAALKAVQEPVAWPCVIAEADFEQNTVTLEMQCSDYKVVAGQHWLHTTPPAAQRQHVTDGSLCWCDPETSYTDPETGASVIVHKGPQ